MGGAISQTPRWKVKCAPLIRVHHQLLDALFVSSQLNTLLWHNRDRPPFFAAFCKNMNCKQRYRLHVLVFFHHFSIAHIVSKKTQEPPPGHIPLHVKLFPPAYPSCSHHFHLHFPWTFHPNLSTFLNLWVFCHHPVLRLQSSWIIYILHPPPLPIISPWVLNLPPYVFPVFSPLLIAHQQLFKWSICYCSTLYGWMFGRKLEIIRVIRWFKGLVHPKLPMVYSPRQQEMFLCSQTVRLSIFI